MDEGIFNNGIQMPVQLQKVNEPVNWQQFRIQASIAAMSIVADDGYNVRNEQHLIAKYAVEIADALVDELKKGGQDETAK